MCGANVHMRGTAFLREAKISGTSVKIIQLKAMAYCISRLGMILWYIVSLIVLQRELLVSTIILVYLLHTPNSPPVCI